KEVVLSYNTYFSEETPTFNDFLAEFSLLTPPSSLLTPFGLRAKPALCPGHTCAFRPITRLPCDCSDSPTGLSSTVMVVDPGP
ncbi:MAG TPA: hypothetical protein VNX28_01115, partial [Gemmataceae bacterium]|nr:hypothetical protein [Gemmataceae bacterium]